MTDRDKIRAAIDIQDVEWTEHEHSISVRGGPKFMFTAAGEIRSIIRDGRGYGENGRKYTVNRTEVVK